MNLFEWADSVEVSRRQIFAGPVVDFIDAYRAIRDIDVIFDMIVAHENRRIQRAAGRMAPAPVLTFPLPASPEPADDRRRA